MELEFYPSDSFKLIQEAKRNQESPSIPPYRHDLIKNVLQEINTLNTPAKQSTDANIVMRRICSERSKRCVLAYQRNRMDRYRDLLWRCGASTSTILPERDRIAASTYETTFVKEYKQLVTSWKGLWLNVDVGGSMLPPKDVFIEVRILKDCGEVYFGLTIDNDGLRAHLFKCRYAALSPKDRYRRSYSSGSR